MLKPKNQGKEGQGRFSDVFRANLKGAAKNGLSKQALLDNRFPARRLLLVNLFLTNLVRISGFSSLFLAIAVFSANFAREC